MNGGSISIPISPGELIDKIAILAIKSERMTEPGKLENVRAERALLEASLAEAGAGSKELDDLTAELKRVNETLWEIEDEIRLCEKAQDFGPRFIELARSVYRTNDRRADIKRQINELLGSRILEEK
ncbi:MAG: DUF6165 family protein, partial [Rhodospirillales bacterium]|nr:DUF6165 family protein [Rhodospirillales bacterium]